MDKQGVTTMTKREGYEYIEYDGEWFADTSCFLKFHGAEWRGAEAV